MKKKLFSILALLLGLMSGMSLTAYADNTETLLTTITLGGEPWSLQPVYTESGRATLETSGNVEEGWVCPEINGWSNSSPLAIGSVTINPAEGYTITKVVFWDYDMDDGYYNALTDNASPFTCYMKSSQRSLNEDMSSPNGYAIAKIEVYGYAPTVASYNVTANLASGAYWATFYSNAGNYQASEGTQVFTVHLEGTGIKMNEVGDRIAKSGEGVVLKKTTTGNFTMTLTETAPAGDFSSNSLKGTMTEINTTGANNYYVLGNGTNGVGFYKLASDGTIGANKAYLTYSGELSRGFFGFGDPTGIDNANVNHNANENIYDLQGRRVAQPTKGLYIVNGKKVFINK